MLAAFRAFDEIPPFWKYAVLVAAIIAAAFAIISSLPLAQPWN